jgi:hypothetical protein
VADVVSDEGAAQVPAQPEGAPFFRPKPSSDVVVNPRRFGLAYLVLAVGVGAAVGLAIVLIGRGSSHHATTGLRAFRPTASGELGAKEIARHVAVKYRQSDGAQLAAVVGQRPNFQGQPLSYYLIRPHDAQNPNKDIALFTVGDGIMYAMCGFGKNCQTTTTESNSEAQLLKREALELTMTTFKSDSSVQTVTTLLPPIPQGSLAIVFKRSDLEGWLHKPMSDLLSNASTKLKPGQLGKSEVERVDLVEAGALYLYDAAQGPDGNAYLRLDPLG